MPRRLARLDRERQAPPGLHRRRREPGSRRDFGQSAATRPDRGRRGAAPRPERLADLRSARRRSSGGERTVADVIPDEGLRPDGQSLLRLMPDGGGPLSPSRSVAARSYHRRGNPLQRGARGGASLRPLDVLDPSGRRAVKPLALRSLRAVAPVLGDMADTPAVESWVQEVVREAA